jgi:hypothetical protein
MTLAEREELIAGFRTMLDLAVLTRDATRVAVRLQESIDRLQREIDLERGLITIVDDCIGEKK